VNIEVGCIFLIEAQVTRGFILLFQLVALKCFEEIKALEGSF
jgi:hypothetical protein